MRQRYIIRFFLGILFGVVSAYATLFYLLMSVYEGQDVSAWEAVYWTVNRLTTTGEVSPDLVYSAAPIQVLSVLIQISGLAFFFAAFPVAIIPALERRIRGVPETYYADMNDHIIICGYSKVVESLIDDLISGPLTFMVIDDDIDTIRELQQKGIPAILGDPTDVKGLTLAGAKAARYIIANREDEEDNVEIVLAASGISEAEIFAVIDDISHAHYFRYAGASHVLSPKKILGAHLAEKATASWRDELFGAGELVSEWFIIEFPIFPGSPFDGLTLREASIPERCGATLVGIWHRGNLELQPGPASMISAENVLVAVGRREELLKLQELTRTIEVPEITERRHCVIAGYGDVGRAIKEVLDSQDVSSTIIDARKKSGHYIQGDATDEKIIHRANIANAASFFAASHIDRDNIFSTLVARKINPDIHILARANSRESTDQLYRAGADFVFSLSTIAAQMLAYMLIGDHVTTLAEGLKVLSIPVDKKLADKRLGRLRVRTLTGCTVIAVALADGSLMSNPGPDLEMKQGMTIIILGYARQVREFKKRFL